MALTVGQSVILIQQGLSFRKTLAAEILAMMDLVQSDELEKGTSFPHWLLTESATLTGVANNGFLTLPTTYIRHTETGAVRTVDPATGRTVFLTKFLYEDIINGGQTSTGLMPSGPPLVYALRSKQLFVSPIPITAYTITHDYYGHDVLPSAAGNTGTNKWLTNAPSLLVNLTGMRVAQDTYDGKSEAKFEQRYKAALTRQTTDMAAREDSDRTWSLGDSDGP
jgi:hypothetical protein